MVYDSLAGANERTSTFGAPAGDGEPPAAEELEEDPGSADAGISSALAWEVPGAVTCAMA